MFPDLEQAPPDSPLVADAPHMVDIPVLKWFISLAETAGLPPGLVSRLTWHSFRSGGASDLFNWGAHHPAIYQYIMRQGRWRSGCFRIYLRLRSSQIADVVGQVLEQAASEHAENPHDRIAQRQLANLRQVVGAAIPGSHQPDQRDPRAPILPL